MLQVQNVWSGLPQARQLVAILAAVAVLVCVFTISRMATRPDMSLLYSGLDASASGEVIASLQGQSVSHEVRGDAIFVPASQRDQLRMTLASQGIPRNPVQGYEILDTMSGFGTTSQMFDAAYWRAKEGELARTILSSPNIQTARVHISSSNSSAFRVTNIAKASVNVSTIGGGVKPEQAEALRFLVASAVPGLSPEDVAVIDGAGRLVSESPAAASSTGEAREQSFKARVERLLEARVGPGNAIVEVSIETTNDVEMISERLVDPDSRVTISSDTEERSTSENSTQSGVTVASNLPDGDGGDNSGSSSENSETRQRLNYEVSETRREITRNAGTIKRLSVAVLVNERSADEAGVVQPRSETELSDLRALVESAVGFDADRGDVITLKTLEFEAAPTLGSSADAAPRGSAFSNPLQLVQTAVLAVVALLLGLFVVRPLLQQPSSADIPALTSQNSSSESEDAVLLGGTSPDGESALLPSGASALPELPGLPGGDDEGGLPQLPFAAMSAFGTDNMDDGASTLASDATDFGKLREVVGSKDTASLEVLRNWMEEKRSEENV